MKKLNQINKEYMHTAAIEWGACTNQNCVRSWSSELFLAVKKIGSHEKFQRNLPWDGKLWDLRAAVGVADFVGEILAHLSQYMGTKNRKKGKCN